MTRAKLRPAVPNYAKLDDVRPQPAQETRIERMLRTQKVIADGHYWKPPHGNGGIRFGCPECAASMRWFTYSLSIPYHAPLKIRWGSR